MAVVGVSGAALCGAGALAASVVARRRRSGAARMAAAAAVPEACRTLAAEFAAGAVAGDALDAAALGCPPALRGVLTKAAQAERLGAPVPAVLAAAPAGCESLAAVAVCWEVSRATGVGLAVSLNRLASVISAEFEMRAVVDAELAGARLSAAVMACLPMFGLALGSALGADPVGFLAGGSAGRACLALSATLDAAGLLWVRSLAARAMR
ncbi:MAG: type II secretion system F family protein [Rubrivivax sp.]